MIDRKTFKVEINNLIFPTSFRLEEVAARQLLMWYGYNNFIGVEDGDVIYTEGGVYGTDEKFDAEHVLPIACGQGRYGKLHPVNEIATDLGLVTHPPLVPLLNSFMKREGSQLRLEVLFRAVRRMPYATDPSQTVTFMSDLLHAVISQCEYNLTPFRQESTLLDIAQRLIDKGAFPYMQAREYMLEQIKKSMGTDPATSVTELSHVVKALFRKRDLEQKGDKAMFTLEQIEEWVRILLEAFYQQQIDFQEAVKSVKDLKPILVPACIGHWRGKLKLLVVESDNDQSKKAAMSRGIEADIVLHREKTSGRRHIFFNPTCKGLTGENLAKMIEWTETPDKHRNRIKWSNRGSFSQESGVTYWHIDSNGNIHNGTKYRAQKLSELTDDQLIAMIMHAFHFGELKRWCSRFGITMSDAPKPARQRASRVRDNNPAKPPTNPAATEQVKAGNGMEEALAAVATKLPAVDPVVTETPAQPVPAPTPTPTESQPADPPKRSKKKGVKPVTEHAEVGGKPLNGNSRRQAREEIAEALEEAPSSTI